jgi:pSer/pThr/pTyr-binding forkhead associated (FHA) protein
MWKLLIRDDDGRQTVVPLKFDEYVVGRKPGSRIRLVERNVSRQHARIRRAGGESPESQSFTIEDLSSSNGTFVNGGRIQAARSLSHGDTVQIGDYRMVLQDDTKGDVIIAPLRTADEPDYEPD